MRGMRLNKGICLWPLEKLTKKAKDGVGIPREIHEDMES